MAIKFLMILVVAMGAFACAVNGRALESTTDELDEQKTFFHHKIPPYFKGLGGFGKPGFKGWKKGWFGGKPVAEKPKDGNVEGGSGNGTTGGDSGGNTGTGAIGSLENGSGAFSSRGESGDAKIAGRGDKHHGKP